ncbi:hypothetical protein CYMTET_22675 [Cymbomonas tetramitiformis]|uniref:Uncharacterized protein n=1 Tax=Cymbomonas tetramitiformis TaxID=36881 RepID=A0AAE0FZE7_9CHLO|nr:hypothetical protein CYMTET_22675 [Cymbomonas tetramitiformis]
MDCVTPCLLSYTLTIVVGGLAVLLWYWRTYRRLYRNSVHVKRSAWDSSQAGAPASIEQSDQKDDVNSLKPSPQDRSLAYEDEGDHPTDLLPEGAQGARSLAEYLRALKFERSVDMEAVVTTLITKVQMTRALPIIALLPERYRRARILTTMTRLVMESALMGKPFSPMLCCATAETLHRHRREPELAALVVDSLSLFASGGVAGDTALASCLAELPNPFILSQEVEPTVARILQALHVAPQDADCIQPSRSNTLIDDALLPGLCIGTGDLLPAQSPRQSAEWTLAAVLMNRLSANTCAALGIPVGPKPAAVFCVQLLPDHPLISDPAEFIGALIDFKSAAYQNAPSDVHAYFNIRQTSFGVDLCVQEPNRADGENATGVRYTNLAMCLPMYSGLRDRVSMKDVNTLATHAGLQLEVKGPLINFNCQYYQGVECFTGWHPNVNVSRPWCKGMNSSDRAPLTASQIMQAVRLCAAAAVGANQMATRRGLLMGGYGVLGVCNDSVALIEMAVMGHTTIFPLMSHGAMRFEYIQELRQLCSELKSSESGHGQPAGSGRLKNRTAWLNAAEQTPLDKIRLVEDMELLISTTTDLPNDIQFSPKSYVATLKRMRSSLSSESPFKSDHIAIRVVDEEIQLWT